ncbi:MAG: phospholipase D-like domain-containing protein [Nocardioides sp.]|uniref:phospholipase D-like domain-containing protein n=1 Tax=Nocardioides sp. TaxID=35761 RepID=UPI003F11F0EF
MSFVRRIVPGVAASLIAATLVAGGSPSSSAEPGTSRAESTQTPTSTTQQTADKKKKFRVAPGVTFNNAIGTHAQRRAIIRKVNNAINNAPTGSEIRIYSWKVWTYAGVTALLNAQKRGVKIRVIMDKKNTEVEVNPHFPRLKKGLASGNRRKDGTMRPKNRRSYAKLCAGSCRGPGGAAHAKYFIFSKSGRSENIYMHSSSNWGDAAASRQWNDLYTFVGNKGIYDAAVTVFEQAWQDKAVPVRNRWFEHTSRDGSMVVAWSPTTPKSRDKDRLKKVLSEVRCRGAESGYGTADGRTIIRSAPDVIRGKRGLAIAKELRRLWIAGCDVKIAHTVMGIDVNQLLNSPSPRGPVPTRQLVQDFDGDGVFDRYFHMKSLTINGRIGANRKATWLLNGSANLSQLGLVSDENLSYLINRPNITKRYQNHIEYWYNNFPKTATLSPSVARMVRSGDIDPYAKMEMD